MNLTTYVNFGGSCEEAFQFYEKHLGGKITSRMRWKEMPAGSYTPPPEMSEKLVHARMELGETQLMGADVPGAQAMRSAYLSLAVKSNEEAERIYEALKEGGEVFMALGETFFAHRFGQLRDRFGINWMVIHERSMPSA